MKRSRLKKKDSTVLLNPERGFYYVLEMTASTDSNPSLSISDVLGLIPTNNQNISILLVEIFLDSFITSDISATVLDKLKNVVFPAVRSLNVKSLIRFAYTNDIASNGVQDATETQLMRHINQLTPVLQVYFLQPINIPIEIRSKIRYCRQIAI